MGRALGTGHRAASALPVIQHPSRCSLLACFPKFVPKLEGGRGLEAASRRPGLVRGREASAHPLLRQAASWRFHHNPV